MKNDGINELLLAGFVPLRKEGLALPCYASGPQSNAWYCARCSTDGDRHGTIVEFDPFESADIIRLPEGSRRVVSVGDDWQDVLVWGDDFFVGTPDIILTTLGDRVAELAAEAPLELLDLAMPAQRLDRAALVASATVRLEALWGRRAADSWQTDIFMRQGLMLELRRLLSHSEDPESGALIRQLEIVPAADGFSVELTAPLTALLHRHKAGEAFERRVEAFGYETGLPITCPPLTSSSQVLSEPVAMIVDEPDDDSSETLIMVSGARAAKLARQIRLPGWIPDWGKMRPAGEFAPLTAGRFRDPARLPAPDILEFDNALPLLNRYRVVIWLTDGHDDERYREIFADATQWLPGSLPLVIVAPTLPADAPPAMLAKPAPDMSDSIVLLDTATVRSPFWPGNSKRSIDRRVVDLIGATVRVTAPGTPLYSRLTDERPNYQMRLLSVATEQPSDWQTLPLASEISAVGLKKRLNAKAGEEYFRWEEISFADREGDNAFGEAMISRHDPEFAVFVREAIRHTFKRLSRDERILGEVPDSIATELRYPHLSAAFQARDRPRRAPCVLTAEAPQLSTLRAAAEAGWTVARYSDSDALRKISDGRGHGPYSLPSDITLPALNRLGRNRGLVVRGIDPRDIIRVPFPVFEELRRRFRGSHLEQAFRRYRADIAPWAAFAEPDNSFAVPKLTYLHELASGTRAARYLADAMDIRIPTERSISKRTADLRASWSAAEAGTRRTMLADGKLPLQGSFLDEDEVAAQRFFTVDGDAAVPLLFGSRLFHVWASATITRSASWSSRFSITRTFETFPISEEFLILNSEETGRAHLRAPRATRSLRRLLEIMDDFISEHQVIPTFNGQTDGAVDWREFEQERDQILLEMFGLQRRTSDLDILEHLVKLNRRAGS